MRGYGKHYGNFFGNLDFWITHFCSHFFKWCWKAKKTFLDPCSPGALPVALTGASTGASPDASPGLSQQGPCLVLRRVPRWMLRWVSCRVPHWVPCRVHCSRSLAGCLLALFCNLCYFRPAGSLQGSKFSIEAAEGWSPSQDLDKNQIWICQWILK